MRRADRLFRIVQILRNRRFVTAEQLAEKLEVSQRTIYRDIRDIGASGVPVKGEAGVGYCLERGAVLPPLTFNSEEIEALVLGARMAVAWADPALAVAARSVLEKVETMLPEPLRDVLLRTALFAPTGDWARQAAHGLEMLRTSIGERRKISFQYTRDDGDETTRVVRPLGLYFWGAKWTLGGWCELRQGYRTFRPDRMNGLRILEEQFDEKDGITLEAFLAETREQQKSEGIDTKNMAG